MTAVQLNTPLCANNQAPLCEYPVNDAGSVSVSRRSKKSRQFLALSKQHSTLRMSLALQF